MHKDTSVCSKSHLIVVPCLRLHREHSLCVTCAVDEASLTGISFHWSMVLIWASSFISKTQVESLTGAPSNMLIAALTAKRQLRGGTRWHASTQPPWQRQPIALGALLHARHTWTSAICPAVGGKLWISDVKGKCKRRLCVMRFKNRLRAHASGVQKPLAEEIIYESSSDGDPHLH